ncbi:hypothetical protein pETSU_114 [Edwardsiella phage pEt-SU]|uniref:Uncharacterized protein n=1 Tax=Edwardsiella phage pEt-SU TaxID=2562142 RepID=A0A4D6DWL0_9CAUD|nr:hypothetical protein HOV39_gp114 [Edwardsiella phage pEt-SU]QBZ70695.1 hypothetical protein pETSU_114 [Edwardsiella phage pEt-SU]
MSTKKVQNSSQSGKTNKGFGAGTKPGVEKVLTKLKAVNEELDAELAKVAVNTTGGVVVEDNPAAVAPDVVNSVDDEIDVDFSFGRTKAYGLTPPEQRTRRKRGTDYKDEPIIYIAGVKQEGVKLDKAPKNAGGGEYRYNSNNPLAVSGSAAQRFNPGEVITEEPIQWYHVVLPEIDIYITQGSELTIEDRVNAHSGWEGEEGDWIGQAKDTKPELIIIGSVVRCSSISLGSLARFNNSNVETNGHIDTINSRIHGCRIFAYNSIDLYNCGLYSSRIDNNNRLIIRNSNYLRNLHISGFDNVDLLKVHNSGEFRIHAGWQPTAGLGLNIADCHLTDFSGDFRGSVEQYAKEYGDKKPWQGNGMVIRRRTDYGYFAGSAPVPFVRCGDYNISTSNNLYLAKEIDQVSFPKEKAPLAYQPQFGGGFRSDYQPPLSMEDNSYTMGLRGGKLWEKARKDCFTNPNNHEQHKRPIGAIGDNLIQSLVEQIKSRIKLYVELSVLTEV